MLCFVRTSVLLCILRNYGLFMVLSVLLFLSILVVMLVIGFVVMSVIGIVVILVIAFVVMLVIAFVAVNDIPFLNMKANYYKCLTQINIAMTWEIYESFFFF